MAVAQDVVTTDMAAARPRHGGGLLLRKIAKGVGIAIGALVVLVVIAVIGSAVARGQVRQLAAPTGPSAVGRIELSLTDAGRTDPFASDGRRREIPVWIWYPTAAGNTGATAPYLPKTWADAANGINGPASVLFQDYNAVRTSAIAGAPLVGKSPPVVVLMPGLGASVAEYSELAEDLASHGYAVVGINPTGSSQVVGFPDGRIVYATPEGGVAESNIDAWYASASRVVGVWVDDASFVVSALTKTPPALGALDFSRVAYVGHSLGGNASFEACALDTRCVAAVDLDGTIFSQVRRTGLRVPGLILQANDKVPCDDAFCQRKKEGFKALTMSGPVRDIALDGAEHLNFSDNSVLFMPVLGPIGQLGSIDGARSVLITRDVVRAFLDQGLRGTPASTFDATIARYPELHEP
jgi:pimeloyl-ACP methyl ester carboxylesterase